MNKVQPKRNLFLGLIVFLVIASCSKQNLQFENIPNNSTSVIVVNSKNLIVKGNLAEATKYNFINNIIAEISSESA